MSRSESSTAAEKARADYAEARNCAEAVLRSVQEAAELPPVPVSAGSAFTTGIGNTGCVCGALAGAVMMLGAYAETEGHDPEARRLRAEELAAEFLERFTERWGATCCRVIKRGFVEGSTSSKTHCADITENAAEMALAIIAAARAEKVPRRAGPRDLTARAQRLAIGGLSGAAVGLALSLAGAAAGIGPVIVVFVSMAAGIALALWAEAGGAGPARRAVRGLRAAGVVSVAVFALAAALSGRMARVVLDALVAPGVAPALLRDALALALVVLASVRAFELVRYR